MRRAAAILGVVAVLVVAVVGGLLFWGSWISPGERRAMRAALDQIDEVAKYEGNDQAVYEKRLQDAKTAILLCEKKEVTAYDRQLVPLLKMQLDGAQTEHTARLKAGSDVRYARMLPVVEDSNRKSEALLREHLQ